MENSKNRQQTDHLGVNKMGKGIRKSPLHQTNLANNPNRQPPQPQVYNISKNDFRNIVQQLTGSPARDPLPRPPQNPPKSQSMRLQKIRPPPLTPINRPQIAPLVPPPPVAPPPNGFVRAGPPGQFGQPSQTMMPQFVPGDSAWANTAESPISAYMRYLQNSMMEPTPRGVPAHPSLQQPQPHMQPPNSAMPALPSPRFNGPLHPMPNQPAPLPSPTSQFLLPSPTGYMNLLSPGSPYPLLSPSIQFPPPLTPNFAFSPMPRSGDLGPPSPGFLFPLSPTGFFPISSPRWRNP